MTTDRGTPQRDYLARHDYERSPHSGAGNCWCGGAVEDTRHPHIFTPMRVDPMRCVCLKPPNHNIHIGGS